MIGCGTNERVDRGVIEDRTEVIDDLRAMTGSIAKLLSGAAGPARVDVAQVRNFDVGLFGQIEGQRLPTAKPHDTDANYGRLMLGGGSG